MKTLLAALAVLLLLPSAALADVPENADWSEAYIETDGQPMLHADVLKPKGTRADRKLPVIVAVGPYHAHGGDTPDNADPLNEGPNDRWDDLTGEGRLFERGYALVLVDLRGFGASEGCNDFGGTGEQTDAKRAVEWAAAQPWSTGRVGMWGKSYDGWTQVMALDEKPRGLAAAIIQSPIIDGYRTLYNNGVHYDAGWYATPGLYQSIDAIPPTVFDSPEYFLHTALGTDPACYAMNIALQDGLADRDDALGFWKERDLPGARGSDVPVLWSHGFLDANTKPDNFESVWSTLTGPKRAWFGQFDHVRGNEANKTGKTGFFDQAFRWLDRHVKGDSSVNTAVDPDVEVAEGDGRWRGEATWPPADVIARRMEVAKGSYTDDGNLTGSFGEGSAVWSVTRPFPAEARLAGVPKLTIDATSAHPRANLIAQLFAVDPDGKATLLSRGAHVIKSPPAPVTYELYPNDWTIPAGWRIALRVTSDDFDWYMPPFSQADVTVNGGMLELPFLTYVRDGFTGQAETGSMRKRQTLELDAETMEEAVVAFEQPPALIPRPAGTEQGGSRPPQSSRPPANRLAVKAIARGRRLRITVRGAGTAKVRLTIRRGRSVVARRTVTARDDVARASVRLRRAGRYRVAAKLLGGLRLSGTSKTVRVR